jgi:hypothetical protein
MRIYNARKCQYLKAQFLSIEFEKLGFHFIAEDLVHEAFFLGVIGLFTRRRSRLFAIWGLALCISLLIFTFLMVISSLCINYKP